MLLNLWVTTACEAMQLNIVLMKCLAVMNIFLKQMVKNNLDQTCNGPSSFLLIPLAISSKC